MSWLLLKIIDQVNLLIVFSLKVYIKVSFIIVSSILKLKDINIFLMLIPSPGSPADFIVTSWNHPFFCIDSSRNPCFFLKFWYNPLDFQSILSWTSWNHPFFCINSSRNPCFFLKFWYNPLEFLLLLLYSHETFQWYSQ